MASIFRLGQQFLRRMPSPPRQMIASQFHTIEPQQLIEEETLPFYKPEKFYPVRFGEIFRDRYQVLGKLGYGAYSTVWFCRDLPDHRYVAIKVYTQTPSYEGNRSRELETYKHLSRLESSHPGQAYVRRVYDTFEIDGPDGCHTCIVHPPMHMTLDALQRRAHNRKLDETILRETLLIVLRALDFLHNEANVVHTDIKASNIMFTIRDESMLGDFEKAEQEDPSARKIVDAHRTIYESRKFRLPKSGLWGVPVLCDFGESRIGKSHRGIIQPQIYRAPEVHFNMEWSYSVDIWSVGVMIWDLFEHKHMFNGLDEDRKFSASHHIAEMVAFLGLPPKPFLQKSDETRYVFDENGNWKGAGGVTVPLVSFENSEENLEGKDKALFLQFVGSMVRWVPEDRSTAQELLNDPWLNERFDK